MLIKVCVRASNELNSEKQAVVQRTVLSQRVGDDIARCIAPLICVFEDCYSTRNYTTFWSCSVGTE